jgi:hypothetical protein
MPISLKQWGIFWFKNNSEAGAQAEAIKALPNQSLLLHSQTVKLGRMWGHTTPSNFLKQIEINHGLYEIIHSYPHKVYFDVDEEANVPCFQTYINEVKSKIETYFPNADLAISGSYTEKKTSLHVIVNNYLIQNDGHRDTMRAICKEAGFDWKVYTKNRQMKCINQSKPDGRIQAILECEDYKKHCITHFMDISLPFPIHEHIQEKVQEQTKTFNLLSLPKMVLETDVDYATLDAMQILKLLPLDKSFDHTYTHMVARFANANEISFEDFYSWIQRKDSGNTYKQKWTIHWGKLSTFPPVTMDKMKQVCCYFYPKLKQDIFFRHFQDTFEIPPITPIETITQDCFQAKEKILCFNVGMGGGKTSQTIDALQSSFCWIAPNKALAGNTDFRLKEMNKEVTHYLTLSSQEKKKNGINCKSLICVLNSLHYVVNEFDTIVIDEIETVLDKFMGDFLEGKMSLKKHIWDKFCFLLRQAKRIIVLDAFITTKTTNFLKHFGDMCIYTRKFEPQTRQIVYMKNYDVMLHDMVEKIKSGSKIFCFYPYKKDSDVYVSMEKIFQYITDETGKKGIFYNADIDDHVKTGLKNINETWKDYSFILTNNIITCGVNYENLDFDYKYLFIGSFNTPRDIIQVSYRARHLSTGIIKVCYLKGSHQNAFMKDTIDPIYDELYKSIMIEKMAPLRKAFQLFCKKAHYKQTTDKTVLSDVLSSQLNNQLQKYEIGFVYDDIEKINYPTAMEIQTKCFDQEATQYEKVQLEKYFFRERFYAEDMLPTIWNSGYIEFFKQLTKAMEDNNSVFKKIAILNNCEFFPNLKKIKLNDEIKEQIFKEFKFKFITTKSSNQKIVSDTYNLFFKHHIIHSTQDGHHSSYHYEGEVDDEAGMPIDYYEWAKTGLITCASMDTITRVQNDDLEECFDI